jgi:hypothetical protein
LNSVEGSHLRMRRLIRVLQGFPWMGTKPRKHAAVEGLD